MIESRSIIENHVAYLDTGEASRKLLQLVKSQIYGDNFIKEISEIIGFPEHLVREVYEEDEKIRFGYLAVFTGITEDRIDEILSQENPKLYREEVNSLCFLCGLYGIGADEIFGLPSLDSDEAIKTEYILMKEAEDAVEVIHKTLKNQKIEVKPVEDLKIELNLYCLRKCLQKYPSIDDGWPS